MSGRVHLSFLIQVLQEIESTSGDIEVRVATQPSYPLAHAICNVRLIDGVVWVATENPPYNENPYANKEAWEEA